jgi:hypothetical protein
MEDPTDRAAAETVAAGAVGAGGAQATLVDDGSAGGAVTLAAAPVVERTPSEWLAVTNRIAAYADSTDSMLRRVRDLSRLERVKLRRDVNATQIARARLLGIKPDSNLARLVASGQLVKLADSTQYWVVRDLNFSVPYVVPGAEMMLAEIGRRFQQRLDSLHVPIYRLDITSVLRTPQKQEALRRANANASRIVSAHEFGTTVDIAYRRFAAPVAYDDRAGGLVLGAAGRQLSDSLLISTGNLRSAELQAVLGRVIAEMRSEGKIMVMMERHQTVYHITLARAYPHASRVPPLRHSLQER